MPVKKKVAKAGAKAAKVGLSVREIKPITYAQQQVFEAFFENHLMLHGIAGTGKTFTTLYLALREVLEYNTYHKVVVVRSAVPTRDIGFMPGTLDEKIRVYEQPYRDISNDLCERGDAYDILKQKGIVEFMTTSFIRGLTINNAIVLVDEVQNMTFQEIDSVMTRVGENTKIIFCGDFRQSDFKADKDKKGLHDFLEILRGISRFEHIEFRVEDIVRSGIVKQYIIAKTDKGFS